MKPADNKRTEAETEPDKRKRILKERAKHLAKERTVKKKTDTYREILEFELASERYGLDVAEIQEIHPLQQFTQIPCTPSFVFGIINVRGRIISIINLKKFFGLPEQGITNLNKVIIVKNKIMELGILADTVTGFKRVTSDEIHAAPASLSGIGAEYVSGITSEGMIILDSGKILSDKKIIVNETVVV
jgi:purine-binding chemotaxis protein CheW